MRLVQRPDSDREASSVRIGVRLFARYREATGRERLDVELPAGSTVETAWTAVVDRHPELAQFRAFTLFAVGQEYVQPDHLLGAGDELYLFPPVSGGSGSTNLGLASRRARPSLAAALGSNGWLRLAQRARGRRSARNPGSLRTRSL